MESTPTRLPEPPRSVRGGGGCGLWFLRLFILPHTLVGIGVIGLALASAILALFGTDTTATVTKAYTSTSSKGSVSYHLEYVYQAGGRDHTKSQSVSRATYDAIRPPGELEGTPSSIRVRYLRLGSWSDQVLLENGGAWRRMGGLLFFALFWNGILSVFLYLAWVKPIRQRLLVKYGDVTAGTILSSRKRQGKSISYYVTFRFRNPETGADLEREVDIQGEAHYQSAVEGRKVTVIYSPRNPKRALIYELSPYQVEGAQPT